MYNNKKLFIMIVLLIVSLFLTEAPYINIFFAGKIWIFYLLFLFYLFPPRNLTYIIVVTFISLVALILTTFLGLSGLAELIGVLVFALLCLSFVIAFYRYIKERQ